MNTTTAIGVTHTGRIVYANADGEREFSPRTQRTLATIAFVVLIAIATLGAGLATGLIEPAAWSPMGGTTQHEPAPVEPPTIDELRELVPPGYEPAVPLAPAEEPGLNA